jgi:8-oxo-dGTP diphosphatase
LSVNNYSIAMTRQITKIGLAVLEGDRLLLVKKKGSSFYILPGGKPERGESDVETLAREVEEELGCDVARDRLIFLGAFCDEAAGTPGVTVTVRLYAGALIGTPSPRAEIDGVLWWTRTRHQDPCLAPSLRNSILPFLCQTDPAEQEIRKSAS